MDWLAHSAKGGYPAQTYADHVGCAVSTACRIAADASHDLPQLAPFVETVGLGTEYHDLGKLDDDNQSVLASPTGKALPREHVDAGTKHLFGLGTDTSRFAGMLAYAHHRGLPDVPDQKARGATAWRGDEKGGRFDPTAVIARTSAHLGDYLHRHGEALARSPTIPNTLTFKPAALDLRMALGCLVDADHGYGNALSVMRTVEEMEKAGVCAMSVEDTLLPRRFGVVHQLPEQRHEALGVGQPVGVDGADDPDAGESGGGAGFRSSIEDLVHPLVEESRALVERRCAGRAHG